MNAWANLHLLGQPDTFLASPGDAVSLAGLLPGRARSHCRFVLQVIHFIPDLLTYSVPLFLKRQCDRTLLPGAQEFDVVVPEGVAAGQTFSVDVVADDDSPVKARAIYKRGR